MAKAKKFGTFGGVFTPAILTILGVIMYMRMPWVVGNGGLWMALGIVAVAHVVSLTTGLSVSSMATDKRVKAGGSYYILSRSLGLPIGGTLGIALFVGLSFSVSLYVIGFSESFLGYFDQAVSTHNIRVVGSVVLFAVAAVTLISTALAIKTQFFIMAAIVISLVSVLVGSDLPRPDVIHIQPLADGASLAVLFGIFFPAVTGFEAGVSMSGDLRDPKRSIPVGTMLAIGVGMIVYVGLAVFLAWRIPADALANNPRVLLDYAWIEELVIPGIWGATVSSALGSILGAPRILQACAADGIGPRFFERGHGPAKEPRNALLLTTLLAWSGVLVGELDTIARIVSMFFLTSYGFLNLAAFIESWVSPDFRPDFRIPRVVSLVGALVCFVLMIQLDFAAMVAATVAMALLYALLKRRELAVEGGDTWSGVWAALVRWSLAQLGRDKEHERNWRPHLISFGGESLRPLAEHICGRAGLLSDLSAADSADWAEREAASRYHGLPGLTPNTVLLSLEEILADPAAARAYVDSLDPERFNVLISRGRGAVVPGRIDVWWRGRGGSLAFALALIRALTTARRWRLAGVRFHLPIAHPTERRVVERRITHWLEQARVRADIRTVDPEVMPPIERLSADAAITILGLPQDPDPERWAQRLDALTRDLPNCLLVRPANTFKNPLGDVHEAAPVAAPAPAAEAADVSTLLDDEVLASYLADIEERLADALLEPLRHADHAIVASLDATVAGLERAGEAAGRRLEHARVWGTGGERTLRIQTIALEGLLDDIERVPLQTSTHSEWVAAAVEGADQALVDVVLGATRAVRVKRVQQDGRESVAIAEGRMDRLFRSRALYIQADLADLVAGSAAGLVARAVDRLVAARLQHVTMLHSAVLTLARAITTPPVAELPENERWRQELGEVREALDATRRAEQGAARAAARTVAEELAQKMRAAKRRWVSPRAARVSSWLDVEELTESAGPRLAVVDQSLQLTALELRMTIARERLRAAVEEALRRGEAQLEAGLRADIAHLVEANDDGAMPLTRGGEFDSTPLLGDMSRGVELVTQMVPESVQVVPDVVIARIEADTGFDGAEVQNIAVRQFVGYMLDSQLLAGVRTDLRELERAARRGEDVLRDAARFAADSAAADLDVPTDAATEDELRARAAQALESLDAARKTFREAVEDRLETAGQQLAAAEILRQAGELSRFVRTQKQMQLVSSAARSLKRWRSQANRRLVDLSLRWEGELARGAAAAPEETELERLAAFRARVAPSRALMEALPVFYRRAFTGRTTDNELLIGTDAPLAAAAAAIALHNDGGRGSLLVTGPPGAGVTTLVRLIARDHFRERRVVEVNAPAAATNDARALTAAIADALREEESVVAEAALRTLPRGSVVILHDVELWFLRGAGQLKALARLHELIERLSGRLLFVITTTDACAALLAQLELVEPTVLARVRAPDLTAGEAMDAVMRRHATAGLSLEFANGEAASELALARHFAGLRAMAGGAAGPLLTSWLAHATEVEGEILRLRPCVASELPQFPTLPPEALAVANALALHRRIADTAVDAALGADSRAASLLVRAGVARRRAGSLQLDPAMRPHLVAWLKQQGALE